MVKLFGIKLTGGSANDNQNNRKRWNRQNNRKDRQSPTLPVETTTPEVIREKFPIYQYALDELAQTVPPGTSNSDGIDDFNDGNNNSNTSSANDSSRSMNINNDIPNDELRNRKRNANDGDNKQGSNASRSWTTIGTQAAKKLSIDDDRISRSEHHDNILQTTTTITSTSQPPWAHNSRSIISHSIIPENIHMKSESGTMIQSEPPREVLDHLASSSQTHFHPPTTSQLRSQKQYSTQNEQDHPQLVYHPSSNSANNTPLNQNSMQHTPNSSKGNEHAPMELYSSESGGYRQSSSGGCTGDLTNKSTNVVQFTHNHNKSNLYQSPCNEDDIPGATYEEVYGDAYTGGRLTYIYPSGYQSMRPRSCPWRLSIVICLLFTWLSIFIVGHCSDQVEYDGNITNDDIDDDKFVIDIRWCGSRPLYLMWVVSMLITGLSASYCSIIGYIKVRDFAVANSRSQPPGVVDGKSDYYVRIQDVPPTRPDGGRVSSPTTSGGLPPSYHFQRIRTPESSAGTGITSPSNYLPTIYQSDGTPQFWGSYIYRPTQAAVAITNR